MRKILKEFRLIAAIGLLLIPILLLGGLFIVQSNKDIVFARRELLGTEYLRCVLPIYSELTRNNGQVSEKAFADFKVARAKYDAILKTTDESTNLAVLLAMNGVSVETKMRATRSLFDKIGDTSNLVLDPNLDTYYLMEIAVMKLPETISLSHELHALSLSQRTGFRNEEIRFQSIEQAGQMRATLNNVAKSIEKISLHNSDRRLRNRLSKLLESNLGVSHFYAVHLSDATNASPQILDYSVARHNFLVSSVEKHWVSLTGELERLLQKRISNFKTRFNYAIGITLFVTLMALFFAVKVMGRLLSRLDDQIVYLAHHDPMTALKNRAAFTKEMNSAILEAENTGEVLALHVIDCDSFKSINDTHGHLGGDAVLVHLSKCLLRHSRKGDLVARLGGDEFVVLQRHIEEEKDAQRFAERIVFEMQKPMPFDQTSIATGVTVGIALYPHHAHNEEALMLCADTTLFAAKAAGRNRALCYSRDFETEIQKRRELEQDVRSAMAEQRLSLHFQPQFDTSGTELRGFEALLRLRNRKGVDISPTDFIPIAENIGLIVEYGRWVLEKATKSAALWPPHIALAVNLSPLQFKSHSICGTVRNSLLLSGLDPKRLQLEITEGILLESSAKVREELQALRKLGVMLALDDFGTGFSSLSYLWQFRFDKIKIDRSFLAALENDRENAENIIKTIVLLGHSMEMQVTAEGVETTQQAELMARLKCDEIQGFLYGKPLAEPELPSVILRSLQRKAATRVEAQDENTISEKTASA